MLNGARAVQLFFIISGFTTVMSLERNYTQGGYAAYCKRRYISLFPTYILFVLVYFIIGNGYSLLSTAAGKVQISFIGIVLNCLGLHGFSTHFVNSVVPGGWYIAVLWIYYLLAPLVYKYVKNIDGAVLCVGVALAVRISFHWICERVITNSLILDWCDMAFLNHFVFIAIGQALYCVIYKGQTKINGLSQIIVILVLLYTALQFDTLMIWAVLIAALFLVLSNQDTKVIVSGAALFVGKYSLEIYLVHNAIIHYVTQINFEIKNQYILLLITYILTTVLSLLLGMGANKCMGMLKRRIRIG